MTAANWVLETTFPDPFGLLCALLSSATELSLPSLIPLACITTYDHHAHLLIVTLGPLVLMGIFATSAVGLSYSGHARMGSRCVALALMVSFITLPTVATTIFRTFHCQKLDGPGEDGETFLLAVSVLFLCACM